MKTIAMKEVHYDPSIFMNVETIDEAMGIILTPEAGLTTAQRWKDETAFVMEILKRHIKRESRVLDYGCGIGRLSKPLIDVLDCRAVVGVDISPNMRALATASVESSSFFAIAPDMLWCVDNFDAAIAVWTLQHVLNLELEIKRIRNKLKIDGILFVLNNCRRALPSDAGPWLDDGKDIRDEIRRAGFEHIQSGELTDGIAIPGTFWAVYRKV